MTSTPVYALTRAPEIESSEVQKVEHMPGHATLRLLGKNCDVSFSLDLPRIRDLAEQLVSEGLKLTGER